MFELDKKFVKFKLLYEEKEYAIIITRRAAEQRSQRLLSGCIFVVKNKGKENKIMPKTKLQEVVFTILMVFVMVYAMICYNIALNMGGMSNIVFLNAFHELVIMGPIAFILDFFLYGSLSKKLAFRIVTPGVDKPIMIILAISSITVCLMCPTMSFFATLLFKSAGKEFIAVWFQTTALNFPMAFFWQIFFAGPLVRAIFGMIFKEKEPQVMKEEAEYLEGGEAR
jgi:hypothetical protein